MPTAVSGTATSDAAMMNVDHGQRTMYWPVLKELVITLIL
jgi:hypothetical protein